MRRFPSYPAFTATAVLCLLVAGQALADEPSQKDEQQPIAATDTGETEQDSPWQFFTCTSILFPRMGESEDKIDDLLNGKLGKMFPRWQKPTTFADWRDDLKLMDLQIGVSREINDKLLWFAVFGGAEGRLPNDAYYFKLGRPLKVKIAFEREEIVLATGVDYYFQGQPEFPDKEGKVSVLDRLKASKPYLEAATSYVSVKRRGITSFERPILGEIFHIDDKQRDNEICFSPRIGIDIPMTKKTTFALMAGPSFATSHSDEYDNFTLFTITRFKF